MDDGLNCHVSTIGVVSDRALDSAIGGQVKSKQRMRCAQSPNRAKTNRDGLRLEKVIS